MTMPDEISAVIDRVTRALAATAAERDRLGGTAKAERDLLRESGLLRLSVPLSSGGAGRSWSETLLAVRQLARVDGSLAHLFGFHHLLLATVRLFGDERQWSAAYRESASGTLFWGNALNPLDRRTRITARDGAYVVDGTKTFCSGASDADRLIVSALDDEQRLVVAALPAARPGIRIHDDWDAFGQRQTDSGTVTFDAVPVAADELLRTPGPLGSVFASLRPCLAQLILVNVYLGIGEGAFAQGSAYTREQARPWTSSGVASAAEDPFVLRRYGELWVALEGARALSDQAGQVFDEAWAQGNRLSREGRGTAAVAVATAKVAATRAGLDTASGIFELTGARATTRAAGMDRFWRNLRVHTLHDPIDYKLKELGEWALGGILPKPSFYS